MKKIFISLVLVFLNIGLFSCNPEDISDNEIEIEACCGDGENIPPPPPPPPTGN